MPESERAAQLKEILQQDPANTFARYALGMEYSSAGEVEAAVTEFRTLVENSPDYANAYFMAAQALARVPDRTADVVRWLESGIAAARRSGNRHAESEMQQMLDELAI
jgi:Tfp pilus assembly protein PilF